MTKSRAPSSWRALIDALAPRFAGPSGSTRVSLLLEATSSPLVIDQVERLRARQPELDVRWHAPHAPLAAWEGARIALGEALETHADLTKARVVVALDADFLFHGADALRLARDFANGRRVESFDATMNRLYVAEPALSVTGMSADHRLRVRASEVLGVAAAIATALASLGLGLPASVTNALATWSARPVGYAAWAKAVARDLVAHRGESAILVGPTQPPEVHALGHALNDLLGNVGTVITYAKSPIAGAGTSAFDLAPLANDLDAGVVDTLVVAGGNPVFTAPADLDLGRRFGKARQSAYLGAYVDETAAACQWFAAQAHVLESWGEARAVDGTLCFQQPLAPARADVRATSDLLAALLGEEGPAYERLVAYWRKTRPDFDAGWSGWLDRGVVGGSAFLMSTAVTLRPQAIAEALARRLPPPADANLELALRPDPHAGDGVTANNAWLLELPDPVTRQTWGNAARLSPATAARLSIADGDVIELQVAARTVRAPALVVPGDADDTVTLALGYGRTSDAEQAARGVGIDANRLRTSGLPWIVPGVRVVGTGDHEDLALEQVHSSLEGRDEDILLHRTLAEAKRDPGFATVAAKRPLALYDAKLGGARQWGMVIDLNACTGCAACVVACQAENNIPVVGKAGVAKGRAMHWLRIDRYFLGASDEPTVLLEPMLCQHCEKAPCEYVCPVNATTHSADGLNQMTYNRCVGTRFCSNNCPYKVRRFNWFNYHEDEAPSVAAVHNPDVTVRARGVMEKCTYCVQRIRETEIHEKVTGTPIVDGDILTACEQACPSRAITFGDVSDPTSRVAKLRQGQRRFAVLNELGTIPRTRYLARITNPNPELA